MKNSIIPSVASSVLPAHKKAVWSDRLARYLIYRRLENIHDGRLVVIEDGEHLTFGNSSGAKDLSAVVEVHHPRLFRDMALGGTVGAGKAYIEGLWSCDNLPALFRMFLLNEDVFVNMDRGWSRAMQPVLRFYHFLRRNTIWGSRKNIEAHYDLGNDFFELFLDETLTYSSGVYEREDMTLREASEAKYDRICRKLELGPEDHVIEIGTGWGGFALHAVRNTGCRVTTTTISQEQFELAARRIREAGLEDRITILLKDYRDLEGRFDKLVSIEMIEAVGHQFYDIYFETCSRLLKPEGMALIQAITITDQVYEQHKDSVDFIKRYIFPGSTIPSITALVSSMTRSSDLRLFHLEDITSSYVKTLQEWRTRFLEQIDQVRTLGYSEAFIRAWDFYLTYCEAGFQERYIGDAQLLLVKPKCRREPIVPPLH
jgi:cyclopropane-fatty-acyl-phospholipid synthase